MLANYIVGTGWRYQVFKQAVSTLAKYIAGSNALRTLADNWCTRSVTGLRAMGSVVCPLRAAAEERREPARAAARDARQAARAAAAPTGSPPVPSPGSARRANRTAVSKP